MGSLSDLPEFILHRIQSFLNPKSSAQTTLLSKSWRRAWLTRPTLHLDETHFRRNSFFSYDDPFRAFADQTLQRYEDSDLRLDAFRLHVLSGPVNIWTSKALNLGVTDLTLRFKFRTFIEDPIDVAVHLVKLCLDNTRILQQKVIECSGLRSLTLNNAVMSTESFFNIASGCPSIEDLSLSNIKFSDDDQRYHIWVYGDDQQSNDDRQLTMISLGKLRSLVMCHLSPRFHAFLDDLSFNFPSLKDLTLTFSTEDLVVKKSATKQTISSRSLEILNLVVDGGRNYNHCQEKKKMKRVELDVPSLREFRFTFKGYNLPELHFTPTREGRWESHLSIMRYRELSTTWFRQLSKFLTGLRGSKIHLRLLEYSLNTHFDYRYYEARASLESLSLRPRMLEEVIIDAKSLGTRNFLLLLDGLFWICRPRMIAQYVADDDYDGVNDRNNELLQFMHGLSDLDEVQRMDDSTKKVGFRLKWKR